MLVDLSRQDRVAIITLARPDALNAISRAMLADLGRVLDEVEEDPDVRAVVLTGAGERAFAAGADISEFQGAGVTEAREIARRGQELTLKMERSRLPIIAAINGYALGGGCELALACDVRVASETARLGQPEVTLGIVPGWGGSQRLGGVVGHGVARELVLTGRAVDASEALRIGLVTSVHAADQLLDAAISLATKIAELPPLAVTAAKELAVASSGPDLAGRLARERDAFGLAFTTEDRAEGVAAFLEKRKGRFVGR